MSESFAFRWEHGLMVPLRPRLTERAFQEGSVYWLEQSVLNEPSGQSKRHFFAVLNHAWQSLPEGTADLYPNQEALRKRSLITAGFYDEVDFDVAGDKVTAGQLATTLRTKDSLSAVRVEGGKVYQRTARSFKEMEDDEFARAKEQCFEIWAGMLGVTVEELTKQDK